MKKEQKKFKSSDVLSDGSIVEMVYDEVAKETEFAVWDGKEVQYLDKVGGYYPYPAENHLVSKKVVRFPSEAEEYESEDELIKDVQKFIHKYLDISPFFERIATYYVLFTWVYDKFSELAYLRALGDYGSGKSRLLKVIGSICYKPMFCGGATTTSPIFRIIDSFRGTLILDEADYRFSDTTAEIVKILNSGYQRGSPVLRSEGQGTFEVKSYDVFCPKIIATRKHFSDTALESRFLIEEMDKKTLRNDIPINLPDSFEDEALRLRNKLLMWRFKRFHEVKLVVEDIDRSLEPRLNQIVMPLFSIIRDDLVRNELKAFIGNYNAELISDRGMSLEGEAFEAYLTITDGGEVAPTIKHIAETLNARLDEKEKISARRLGGIIRNSLKLKARRTNQGWIVSISENIDKIEPLKKKYGIKDVQEPEKVNEVNDVNNNGEQLTIIGEKTEPSIE